MSTRHLSGWAGRAWCAAWLSLMMACGRSDEAQVEAAMTAKLDAGDVTGALVLVKSHLQVNPQSDKSRLMLGRLLLSAGDAPGAEVELRRALGAGYAKAAVLPELGRAMLAQRKSADVIALLSGAKADNPAQDGDLAEVLAQALLGAGEPERAAKVLADAIERAPDHLACLLLAARLARVQEDGAQSLATAQGLAKRFASSAGVMVLLAEAQAAQADAPGAAASYEQALKLDPKHAPAHSALVMAALGRNDVALARAHAQRMAKALPGQAHSAYAQAMVSYFSGDFAAAREQAQLLLRQGSNYPPLLVLAGMTERRLGALTQAETLLWKAMALLPDVLEPRRELAGLRVAHGDGPGALALLEPVLAKGVPDAATWAIAGQAYTLSGNFKAADAAFGRAKTLQPSDVQVQLQYARSLMLRGQEERGLRELGKAADADKSGESDMALIAAMMRRKDAAGALQVIERLAQKSPREPAVLVLRGRVFEQLGQLRDARQAFEQALVLSADFMPAVDRLAALDMAANKPQAALLRYESFVKRNPRATTAMIRLAEVSRFGSGRVAATAWLDKAVAVNPVDPAPWLAAVELERRMGDESAALSRARRAAAALPSDYDVQRQLAVSLQNSGENNQALKVLLVMNQLRPSSVEPRLLLAQAHLTAKNLLSARQEIDKALALAPASTEVGRAHVVMLLKEGKPENALAVVRARQKQAPHDKSAWLMEAEIHAASSNWPAAIPALRQGLTKAPDNSLAMRLSDALRRGATAAEAADFEQGWVNAHPDDADFVASLGQAADRRGDAVEAERWYRRTLVLQPDAPVVLNNLATLWIKAKPTQALELAQRAVQLAPDVPPFLDTLAQAQLAAGQRDQALKTQVKAVALAPRSGDFRLQLARLYLAVGEKRKARDELEWLRDRGAEFKQQDEVNRLLAETGS